MSTDSAVSIAWDVLKCLVAPLRRGFRYVTSSESYANNLLMEVGNLKYEAQRVRSAAEVARDNLQNIHEWVPKFLASAEEALKEAEDLLENFEKASKTCCHGTLPDPNCRYQFSRKAKHKIDDIKNLILENSNREISFSGPAPGDVAALIPAGREGKDVVQSTTTAASASSVDFESRALMILNIMDALMDNRYSVVGVHGMGGVGKSTLLVDAEKRIREKNSFDWVAKADVSQNPDVKKIQEEIAHWLGLSDIKKEENVSLRAKLLRERLEDLERKKNKVLIILDNLWERLDLKDIGIPCELDNKVIGCKLLLTARDERVLRREMRCDNAFLLGVLEDEEAKRLFETMVGGKVQVELESLVEEALHICAGLPFLILAISKLFIDTNYSDCKDALKQIWNEETGEVINKTLRVSYDRIKCEEAKTLLQLCAVYGVSKPSLENLVRYSVGLGLFRKNSSMEDTRNRLSSLIHTLQASSLLLHNGENDSFKIHDLVRGFVTSVTSGDHFLLVLKDKDKSVIELSKNKLKSCKAICFSYIDLKELPQELDCPKLQIFMLFTNNKSLEVPDSYFNSMRNLKVLDLSGVRLSRSPSLFQFLTNLHTLCLDHSSLEDVTILGELKRLQILSLMNSKIRRLSKEMGQLVELRLLDLNYCSNLQIIEPGVLGSLIKLEELYMNKFKQWNAVTQTLPTNASLIELNNMKKLWTLHVSILDPSVIPEDLNVKKLTKYEIHIGEGWHWSGRKGLSTLMLQWDPISDIFQKGCIQRILGKTDNMILDSLNGIEQSICTLSQKGFPKLKHLCVENSPSIHYILQSSSHIDFMTLESLLLKNLINLEKIWTSNISSKSFSALKVVRVKYCHNMEVLFPLSSVRELPQLKVMEVGNCKIIRGIVEADESGKFGLHDLHVLKLHSLPHIMNFFTAKLVPLSSRSDSPVGTQIAFFNGQQDAFQRLETLEIIGLDNLRFIFFPSMVKSLTQLKKLTVSNCGKTEAIIMEEEGLGMETSDIVTFPMLTHLHLERLKSLTCFSCGKCARESRSQDHIRSRTTALFNQEVAFPNLETLYIDGMDNIEIIWDNQAIVDSFPKLNVSRIAGNFVALIKLRISNCKMLTKVISDEGSEEGHVMVFNHLEHMKLDGLRRLRCFSSGEYTLMFSLLKDVIVSGCPNMKFFSKGLIQASNLERVKVSEKAWFWEENLNITIQHMFKEMGKSVGAKFMQLSEFPELIGKWHSELNPIKSSWQLELLMVDKCPSFSNVIPSRLMLVLENMCTLQVHDCKSLEEIFDLEGLEAMESTQVLPSFRTLSLVNLPKLRQLWNKDLQESLPYNFLSYITLYKCNGLRHTFVPSMARCLANLEQMEIMECGQMEGVIAEEEGQGSAMKKITFPNLYLVKLECLPNLTCFLSGNNHTLECPVLDELTIAHCPKMRSLMGQSLMKIECDAPYLFTPQLQFPQLKWMILSHMDNLSKIWPDNPQETLTFDYLWEVEVHNCKSLANLFPHWVATSLIQLRKLRVESCRIEEIVVGGDDTPHSNTAQVLFPKLTSLVLHDMPQLQSFYVNLPTLNWPFLNELRVTHCDTRNMLSFAACMNSWAQRDDQQDLSNQEEHSSFERDFPKLQRLLLVDNNIQMIQDGNFPDEIFGKPKALILACFHDEKAVFPPKLLLERFQNLQSLEVFCSSFEDIFPNEVLVDEGKHPVLENLRELKLNKLHNLKNVWREDSLLLKILQSIEILEEAKQGSFSFLTPEASNEVSGMPGLREAKLLHLVERSK
ncbi:uncharacterized protein LOC104452833 isoform X3 [Eucalyptus grandis]|uniref:uncharacterized protein LOC104452833 isoform X3 n=1 Tax=Eucalyptus grandis TaxID=71139 RepID=UPI00192E9781|nr:uncharacterized protein LOC104452833 isoform X3 [Eucalyptus grandis]